MTIRTGLLILAVSAACSVPGSTGQMSSPANIVSSGSLSGDIVFQQYDSTTRTQDLWSVRSDGSDAKLIAKDAVEARWSPDGRTILFRSQRDATPDQRSLPTATGSELYVMNADGSAVKRITSNGYYEVSQTWAPDGRRIAFVGTPDAAPNDSLRVWAEKRQIYVMDTRGGGITQLTSAPGGHNFPAWSPDGKRIAFSSGRDRAGGAQLYIMNADGSNQVRLTHSSTEETYPAWSPNGRQIAFISKVQDSLSDIHVMDPDGSHVRNITRAEGFDGFPSWSADGGSLVYAHHLKPSTPSSLYVISLSDSVGHPIGIVGTRPSWRLTQVGIR
jgi:Tol biopolymer transport system component